MHCFRPATGSTVDLAATFYDHAGPGCPEDIRSRPIKPLIQGQENREVAYREWNLHPSRAGVVLQLRTVRTTDAKLTVDLLTGGGEMSDLADDPHEDEARPSISLEDHRYLDTDGISKMPHEKMPHEKMPHDI